MKILTSIQRILFFIPCCFLSANAPLYSEDLPFCMRAFSLTKKEVDAFTEKGFLVCRGLIDPDRVYSLHLRAEALIERIEPKLDPKNLDERMRYLGASVKKHRLSDTPAILLISWIGGADQLFLDAGRTPEILIKVAQLLGRNTGGSLSVDHLINQLHIKKPGDGVYFPLHQDIENRMAFDPKWRDLNGRGSFVQTLLAIDPHQEDNGPLIVYPFIKKPKTYGLSSLSDEKKRALVNDLVEKGEIGKPIKVLLEPGDVLFFHPLLVHSSEKNTSSISRKALINGFSFPGANKASYPGDGSCEHLVIEN